MQWSALNLSLVFNLQYFYFWPDFMKIDSHYVFNPVPLSVRTMQSVTLATFSPWPHQRTTQRNRNDRLFIIAQPLCQRGKSIIKTRLTAKITAVSSIVLERANFFFPQGSLDQSSITLVQFAPHLKSHCLLELDLPDSFTQWMESPFSEKNTDTVRNCLRSQEVLDSSGTSLCLPLTFQQEGCPHYMEGLGASGGWWGGSESMSWTLKQGMDMRKLMGMLLQRIYAHHELRKEADSCSFISSCNCKVPNFKLHFTVSNHCWKFPGLAMKHKKL